MINSGFISFRSQTGGGVDKTNGNPLPTTDEWSDYVACNISEITREYKMYADGEVSQGSYSIIIDDTEIATLIYGETYKEFDLSVLEQVRLKDNSGCELGEYRVNQKSHLNFINAFKLVV